MEKDVKFVSNIQEVSKKSVGKVTVQDVASHATGMGIKVPENLICRHVTIPPNTTMPEHRHDENDAGIIIIASGSGEFVVDGKSYPLIVGGVIGLLMLYCKNATHHIKSGSDGLSYIVISTEENYISEKRLKEIYSEAHEDNLSTY